MSNIKVDFLNDTSVIIERRIGADKSLPVVIYCHGGADANGNALSLTSAAGVTGPTRNYGVEVYYTIAEAGYRLIAPAMGASFGATAGQDIIQRTYDRQVADGFPDTVHLMGGSAGACPTLNWMWRNPSKVSSIFLFVPLVDVEALYDRDNTFRSAIEAAYGGVPTQQNYDDFDPSHNHANILPQASKIKAWYGTSDTVLPANSVQDFIAAIGCEYTETAAGHLDGFGPQYWDRQEPIAWFNSHNA